MRTSSMSKGWWQDHPTWLKTKTREDLIRRDIAAYSQVRANLLKHSPGFPKADELLAVTRTGQPGYDAICQRVKALPVRS